MAATRRRGPGRPASILVTLVMCASLVEVLSKGGGGGGGTSGSGGRGGGGGGPKNAYSSGSTMSGSTKAGGRWSAGGATTPGGSSVVNYNGRAMSTVPRYYRGAFATRPIVWMAAAGAGGYLAASYYQDVRACDEGTFQYGRNCRKCSAWTCPTGQYRGSCSQHADSWCKLCTNKPEGDYIYTSPGNDNDCAFEPCSTDSASTTQPLCAGVQVPAIDSWSSESPADLVFYMEMPLDQSMFNALGATYKDTLSELTGGAAVSIGAVEAISTEVFTRTKMARVLDSGAQQRREGNLPCAPLPSECELDDSTECLKVLVVETTVTTTLGNVDDTWSKLNEFDLNAIFRAKCLPPVVIKYAEFADSDDKQLDTVEITLIAVGAVISIVSCIAISFFFIRRHRMQKPAAEGNLSGVELPPQALMSVVGQPQRPAQTGGGSKSRGPC